MANQQHKQPQTKKTQKANPSQICASPSSRETKQNSKRGRAQQKQPRTRFAMETVVKSHCVATHKKMHQTNWLLPRKVKHAFLIVVADRQQRKALAAHHCILASQSPLTGSCSGVQFKTKWICRFFFCPSPLPFGGSTVLSLTRGPAGNRTATGSLSATQECRETNWATRTTRRNEFAVHWTVCSGAGRVYCWRPDWWPSRMTAPVWNSSFEVTDDIDCRIRGHVGSSSLQNESVQYTQREKYGLLCRANNQKFWLLVFVRVKPRVLARWTARLDLPTLGAPDITTTDSASLSNSKGYQSADVASKLFHCRYCRCSSVAVARTVT